MENQASENHLEKMRKLTSAAELDMWNIISNLYLALERRKNISQLILHEKTNTKAFKNGYYIIEFLNEEIKKLLAL